MLNKLRENTFIRHVGILVGGTAFAQVLSIAILPVLTRLYQPQDFDVFAIYSAIFTIFSSISCLRLEIAIPLPKEEKQAFDLVVLSLLASIFVVILLSVILMFYTDRINQLTHNKLSGSLWILPISLAIFGVYTALQYWMIRKKHFSIVAKTRMMQSTTAVAIQTGLGYLTYGSLGLLLGHIGQVGAGLFSLGRQFFQDTKNLFTENHWNSLKNTLREYQQFPKYSTWEALANAVGIQLPIILIGYYILGPEAGFILLAMRLLSAPLGLIGGAVAQVYLSEAAEKYNLGKLEIFTKKTTKSLFKIAIVPMLLASILAPFFVPIVFGNGWERVGILIAWMMPWFLMQFIVSPVSMSLQITNNQKIALFLQILGLVLRVGSILIGAIYAIDYLGEIYAIFGFLFYSFYLFVVLRIIRGS